MWLACLAKELLRELLKEALEDKEHENMHRWEENIKMQFREKGRLRVDCIPLSG